MTIGARVWRCWLLVSVCWFVVGSSAALAAPEPPGDEPVVAETVADPAASEPSAEDESRSLRIRERLIASARVLNEALTGSDASIPRDLLDSSVCAIVIPSMKKAGLGVGGRYGRGAVSCRRGRGEGPWGPPSMVSLVGGSFGLQIGYTAVDLVLLVMNPNGIDDLLRSKFTLGGDASVAAGPVGRSAAAGTDARMGAQILAWSRSRGVFAGLEINGAVLKQDLDANEALYGAPLEARKLLIGGTGPIPEAAQDFVHALDRHSPLRKRD